MSLPAMPTNANKPLDYFIPPELQEARGRLLNALQTHVTEHRLERLRKVVQNRSRQVLCVFEDTNHNHNISAVLRSIDAFGFQDAFFIYTELERTRFRMKDSVERGSSGWLCARRTQSILQCADALKQSGRKIALVSLPTFERTAHFFEGRLPHFNSAEADTPDFQNFFGSAPVALVFGNEKSGISEVWNRYADAYLSVPMHGFVESLNMSVCAGILLQALRACVEKDKSGSQKMTAAEQTLLLEHWLSRDVIDARPILLRQNPELVPYLEFLRHGKFFEPFARAEM